MMLVLNSAEGGH